MQLAEEYAECIQLHAAQQLLLLVKCFGIIRISLGSQPIVANIATRPCLISVSRRLECLHISSLDSVSYWKLFVFDSSPFMSFNMSSTFISKLNQVFLLGPFEHLDVLVPGKAQWVPESEGGLVPCEALKASANIIKHLKA